MKSGSCWIDTGRGRGMSTSITEATSGGFGLPAKLSKVKLFTVPILSERRTWSNSSFA